MHKFWKLNESKSNNLIFIKDQVIYKGNLESGIINKINLETTDLTFLSKLFNIPYSYIWKIENQEGKNYIKVFFGNDSEEELMIENENIKQDIFEFLKEDLNKLKYSSEMPSVIKYTKAHFFALVFTTGIFIWSLYLSLQIESGVVYELVGGSRPGITGIVLMLANLGSFNLIIGYLIVLGITIFTLRNRLKSRSKIEYLKK